MLLLYFRKGKKLPKHNLAQNQVLVTTPGNAPIFRTTYISRNPSVQISRDVALPSSTMTIPSTSLVTAIPVQQPLLNSGINVDEIPESDI